MWQPCESLPAHSCNVISIPILRDSLYNHYLLFLPLDILYGFPGKVWYLLVSIPDHCLPLYFDYQSCCVCAVRVAALKVSPDIHLMLLLFKFTGIACTITLHYSFPWIYFQMWYLVVSSPELYFPLYFYTDEN